MLIKSLLKAQLKILAEMKISFIFPINMMIFLIFLTKYLSIPKPKLRCFLTFFLESRRRKGGGMKEEERTTREKYPTKICK